MILSTISLAPVLMLIVLLRWGYFFLAVVMVRISLSILRVLLYRDWQLERNWY